MPMPLHTVAVLLFLMITDQADVEVLPGATHFAVKVKTPPPDVVRHVMTFIGETMGFKWEFMVDIGQAQQMVALGQVERRLLPVKEIRWVLKLYDRKIEHEARFGLIAAPPDPFKGLKWPLPIAGYDALQEAVDNGDEFIPAWLLTVDQARACLVEG